MIPVVRVSEGLIMKRAVVATPFAGVYPRMRRGAGVLFTRYPVYRGSDYCQ